MSLPPSVYVVWPLLAGHVVSIHFTNRFTPGLKLKLKEMTQENNDGDWESYPGEIFGKYGQLRTLVRLRASLASLAACRIRVARAIPQVYSQILHVGHCVFDRNLRVRDSLRDIYIYT
jgi:hypothetical protein